MNHSIKAKTKRNENKEKAKYVLRLLFKNISTLIAFCLLSFLILVFLDSMITPSPSLLANTLILLSMYWQSCLSVAIIAVTFPMIGQMDSYADKH
jgi:hypothetical protein